MSLTADSIRVVRPGTFEPERHFYPKALNATIHPLVRYLLSLDNERIVHRYCHLRPAVEAEQLLQLLGTTPRWFRWSGSDLLHVTTERGFRQMVVVETNSCPSGQKSMPLYDDTEEMGGYRVLLERAFLPMLAGRRLPEGRLAVLYDKNEMEASGYAAAMAELFDEDVLLVQMHDNDPDPVATFDNGVLHVRRDNEQIPIRAAFRYVTQRPWNRIPISAKTAILNPVVACLAGGRNKLVAAKAYEIFNGTLARAGLAIRTPETIWDVNKQEVPLWVGRLGGHAVVKVPYSNAGQGVYTITRPDELDAFMDEDHHYDRFIVQALVGNYHWSSRGKAGRLFHVGTMPNKRNRSFVADLRMMVSAGPEGFAPLAIYARRARKPLVQTLGDDDDSWEILGTNLSVRSQDSWETETNRLMLMDRRDFNHLGVGIDDLIEAYVQTVLSTLAIDEMAQRLVNSKGRFRYRMFGSVNDDPTLIQEIIRDAQ